MADKLSPCAVKVQQVYGIDQETAKLFDKTIDDHLAASSSRVEMYGIKNLLANELASESKVKKHAALDYMLKEKSAINRINHPKVATDPTQGALSLFEPTTSNVEGFGINYATLKEQKNKLFKGFKEDFKKIGFSDEMDSGAYDNAIIGASQFKKEYTGVNADKVSKATAILQKAYSVMLHEARANGIAVNEAKGYLGPIVHDSALVNLVPKEEWITDISNSLDLAKQFPLIPKRYIDQFIKLREAGLTAEMIEKNPNKNPLIRILRKSWESITKQDREESTFNFGYESLEKRRTAPRKFTEWQSPEAIQGYLNKYSKYRTLSERYNYYANSLSNEIAKTSIMGTKPKEFLKAILGEDMNSGSGGALADALVKLGKSPEYIKGEKKKVLLAYNIQNMGKLEEISKIGKAYSTLRQLSASAYLGKAGTTSLFLDTNAAALTDTGIFRKGYVNALFDSVINRFGSIGDALNDPHMEEKYLLSKNQLSTVFEELGNGSTGDKIINYSNFFSGLVSFGNFANRNAHISAMKTTLNNLLKLDFEKIDPITKGYLNKFGIGAEDVAILKNFHTEEFGMMNVNRATVGDIMKIKPELTADQAGILLSSFKEKMNAFAIETVKMKAPMPDAWTSRVINQGTHAGTREGEFRRTAFQFKSTSLKATRDMTIGMARILNPDMGQAEGFNKYMTKSTAAHAARFAGSAVSFGMGLVLMNAILSRDEDKLKRFSEKDPALILEAMARGGLGLFFSDMINMSGNDSQNVLNIAGSPMLSTVGRLISLMYQPFEKNPKPVKSSIKTIKGITPASNQWFFKDFFEALDKEFDEPSRRRGGNSLY